MIFSNIKIFFIGLTTIVIGIFAFLFNRRGTIIDNQEKVINAKEQEIKTSTEVHKSETLKAELKSDIKNNEIKLSKETSKDKSDTSKKILETPDDVPYKIEV